MDKDSNAMLKKTRIYFVNNEMLPELLRKGVSSSSHNLKNIILKVIEGLS